MQKGGSWLFCHCVVITGNYDELVAPESVDLNYVAMWMQIDKLPPGYRKKTLITNLIEKKVGTIVDVGETEIDGVNNFVSVEVKLDI
jgi:hypothetical protein